MWRSANAARESRNQFTASAIKHWNSEKETRIYDVEFIAPDKARKEEEYYLLRVGRRNESCRHSQRYKSKCFKIASIAALNIILKLLTTNRAFFNLESRIEWIWSSSQCWASSQSRGLDGSKFMLVEGRKGWKKSWQEDQWRPCENHLLVSKP